MNTQENLNSKATSLEVVVVDAVPRHATEYQQFIEWMALPVKEREPKTQKELAVQFGLSEWTLSQWKLRNGFWPEVEKIRRSWAKGKTSEILEGLYKKAKEGHAAEVKLWLQYVEDYSEKTKSEVTTKSDFQLKLSSVIKDIRSGAYPNSTLHPSPDNGEPIRISEDFCNDPDLPVSYIKLGLVK